MSSYLTDFFGRVLNLFKKESRSRKDSSIFTTPVRRCNSVIENKRIKEAIASRTPGSDVWKTPPTSKWNIHPEPPMAGEGRSRVFRTPDTKREGIPKRECSSCKGDMNDLQHVLAFCQREIPIRGRRPLRQDETHHGLRRSRSFDSRDALFEYLDRNDDWHRRFHSLRAHHENALKDSRFMLEPEIEIARPRKSVFSIVDSSANRRMHEARHGKSRIPVPIRDLTLYLRDDAGKISMMATRKSWPEDIVPPNTYASRHQVAARNVAHRSRLDAAFDRLFRLHCDGKYRGNIIDCPNHCKWIREAGVCLDAHGFRRFARGKLTLNINEYKCAIKKMCDEAATDYWQVIEKMTSFNDGETSSTISGKKSSL